MALKKCRAACRHSKAQRVIGYQPAVGLELTLKRIISFIENRTLIAGTKRAAS